MMNFELTDMQKDLKTKVTGFSKTHLNNDVANRDKNQVFSHDLWRKCSSNKLHGLMVSEEFGGGGLDPISMCVALEALATGCSDGGLVFSLGAHLLAVTYPVWKYGNAKQKSDWLPKLCDGSFIGANAITEQQSGSDVYHMSVTVKSTEKGYLISGRKVFISNAPVADYILVYASTDEKKGFFGGISAFMVNSKLPGVKVEEGIDKVGVRTCQAANISFEDVFVTSEDCIGKIGGGGRIFADSINWERVGLSACHLGTMNRIFNKLTNYVKTRKSAGHCLASYQAISHKLVDQKIQLEAARLLVYKAASTLNTKMTATPDASIAKIFVSDLFVKSTIETIQLLGSSGYLTSDETSRALRDAIGSTIYSGTNLIQKNIIASCLGFSKTR
jgi:hypothetical protein